MQDMGLGGNYRQQERYRSYQDTGTTENSM